MDTGKTSVFGGGCPLAAPRMGGSVWPGQCCPQFAPRTVALGMARQCWFCQYADFHIREPVALDVGICCWPKEMS